MDFKQLARKAALPLVAAGVLILTAAFNDPTAWATALLEKISAYNYGLPQERFALHTDKTLYTSGETVWLKVYATAGSLNVPDTISGLAYVELLGITDTLLQKHTIALRKGHGHAQLALPDTLPSGNYRLRVYTSWMLNFAPEAPLQHTIEVVNTSKLPNTCAARFKRTKPTVKAGGKDSLWVDLRMFGNDKKPLANQSFSVQVAGMPAVRPRNYRTDERGIANFGFLVPATNHATQLLVRWARKNQNYVELLTVPTTTNDYQLAFFPEGGELIEGVENRVAFELMDAFGRPQTAEISVFENGSTTALATVAPMHEGRGYFPLKTIAGKRYVAVIQTSAGPRQFDLPMARPLGIALQVTQRKEDIRLLLAPSAAFVRTTGSAEVLVVAMQHGGIRYGAVTKLQGPVTLASIPLVNFSTGVVQFTLFSPDGQPWAERLAFVQRNDTMTTNIAVSGMVADKRGKVQVEVKLTDAAGMPVSAAALSVAVTDDAWAPPAGNYPANAFTDLLLQSEIKGQIANPAYYFLDNTPKRLQELDLLMMTRGWRRFRWAAVLASKMPELPNPVERGSLSLAGRITQSNGKAVTKTPLTLFVMGKKNVLRTTITDNEGRFVFDGLQFEDTSLVSLEVGRTKAFTSYAFQLDSIRPTPPERRLQAPTPFTDADTLETDEATSQNVIVRRIAAGEYELSGVTITAKKVMPKTRAELWGKIYGDGFADATLDFTKLYPNGAVPGAIGLELQKIAGVRVFYDQTGQISVVIRGPSSITAQAPPLLLLDNIPVDFTTINLLNPNDVDHIDILKGSNVAIFGSRGAGGVIAVYTRRGFSAARNNAVNYSRNRLMLRMQGLTRLREFYSPNYDTLRNQNEPDLRTTLYWNPTLETDANGHARFQFFQTDAPHPLRISVQGLTNSGMPIAKTIVVGRP